MQILFIGDIFGKPGRRTVKKILPELRKKYQLDLVIANAENLAHGKGATPKTLEEMRQNGVDFFTSGNHIWKNKNIYPELDNPQSNLIRPANYPPQNPGTGYQVITVQNQKVLIINLIGRVFFNHHYDCPFRKVDEILQKEGHNADVIFVDFHAEATSEKIALKHYLDGRITALVGTHTHVPTADAQITKKGTGYISDVGMTGTTDSVIGIQKEIILENFLKQTPVRHEIAEKGPLELNAVLLETDPKNKKTIALEQLILTEEI